MGPVAADALLQVLVVEDDPGDVALVEASFAEHDVGTQLHHVDDGAEALAFLRREGSYADAPRPDLILLDLNMPRVDGRQVLAEVKADADLKSIPVVVFTTSAAADDVQDSYGAHANAYVTKPIDLDDFDRVVAAIRNFYGHTVTLSRRTSGDTRHDGSTS
jgi:two-component system response regulator